MKTFLQEINIFQAFVKNLQAIIPSQILKILSIYLLNNHRQITPKRVDFDKIVHYFQFLNFQKVDELNENVFCFQNFKILFELFKESDTERICKYVHD